MTDPIIRMAAALERLADRLSPARPSADPASGCWFVWGSSGLAAVPAPRVTALTLYAGVDIQRDTLRENARRHAAGLPAHDVLLWGARGMGKSSLVRAVHAQLVADGSDAALVQVAQPDLATLPALFTCLANCPRRFTVFLDDVSLDTEAAAGAGLVHALRSLLDGGVMARPEQVRLVVTSNRRNLVPRGSAEADVDPANPRDVADDQLALADRFGLRLGFHACDQQDYLAICKNYAAAYGLPFDAAAALTWAAGRGARSGRVAWQFTVETAGACGVRL
jgi:predicted AAA+ superfamily ATPase